MEGRSSWGKNYAEAPHGILMLGLNPGGKDKSNFYVGKYDHNCLLPGSPDEGFRYWRHARTLFASEDELLRDMSQATFSFCCPFRTSTWSGLRSAKRDALMRFSRPVLTRMLEDCSPRLVIVAGVASLDALRAIAAPRLDIGTRRDHAGDKGGTYQWRSHDAFFDDVPMIVAQIPHLSRANSTAKLEECGRWLTKVIREAA